MGLKYFQYQDFLSKAFEHWRTVSVSRPGQVVESAPLFMIFSQKFPKWLTQN